MSNADRDISSSRGRGTRRRTRRTGHVVTPQDEPEPNANGASGLQQQQSSPPLEQLPLTQGDIPKIVELIVKQLPVASDATQASVTTQQIPSASTSLQAPPTTLPATITSSAPGGLTLPPLAGTTGTSPITLPQVGNSSEGDGDVAGASVQLPLTVPCT